MISPSREEFRQLHRAYDVVPVFREILADEETPVSAFRKLRPHSSVALLESIEGGETWGRYSMIGLDASSVFESRGREVRWSHEGETRTFEHETPITRLQELVRERRCAEIAGLPRMTGGAVGFASYDVVRTFEKLPDETKDDLGVPDARFVFYNTVVLFDHQFHTVKIVVHVRAEGDAETAYDQALRRIEEVRTLLRAPIPLAAEAPLDAHSKVEPDSATAKARTTAATTTTTTTTTTTATTTTTTTTGTSDGASPSASPKDEEENLPQFASTVSREEFEDAVREAKEYVRSGDVVQVVLAHRLEAEVKAHPFDIYRALRVTNPSPYMFYLDYGDLAVVGASPEVLVRREGPRVEVRPIAGTRPRGKTDEEDNAYEQELLASEKERAEHVMLVDLGRNDIGRVADFGSVEVNDFMVVERYSHVMHIVSNVRGRVGADVGNDRILAACFPAGTLSGAPKIRAMEIIDELEPVRRGIYGGAVGYFDLHGNMDTCIAIRTLVCKDGRAYIGVGAGIVADSDPAEEYLETMNKGSAVIRACELAARGLESFSREQLRKRFRELPKRSER